MKFIILVEGSMEKSIGPFMHRWLDERSPSKVGIQSRVVGGYEQLAKFSVQCLNGHEINEIIGVIGLLDLYGLKGVAREGRTRDEFYKYALEQVNGEFNRQIKKEKEELGLNKSFNPDKFHMYFAVHETEAWFLAQTEILPVAIRADLKDKTKEPEKVNFDNYPSALLNNLFHSKLRRKYKKTSDGSKLFRDLDPTIASKKCPYLAAMLDEMLSLAQNAMK
jgi:hypothetical protein